MKLLMFFVKLICIAVYKYIIIMKKGAKMNLLYSAFIREDSETKGFLKKVKSQCIVFKKEFENVYLYISRKEEAVLYKVERDDMLEIQTFRYNKFSSFKEFSRIRKIRSFLRYNSFLKYLNEIIHLYKIDMVPFQKEWGRKNK